MSGKTPPGVPPGDPPGGYRCVELLQGLRAIDGRIYPIGGCLEGNPPVAGEEDLDPAMRFDGVDEVLPGLIVQDPDAEAAHLPAGNGERPKHDVHRRREVL